jgi:SAM-dependent methyltransferase
VPKKKSNSKTAKTAKKRQLLPFDKYFHYVKAVQSPSIDVRFFRQVYREERRKDPKIFTLCEDFCGTFITCCEWVKLGPNYQAHGVDLDKEPLDYGHQHYLPLLKTEQQKRVKIHRANVLDRKLPKVDIIAALNFSYFLFKERARLLEYYRSCWRRLEKDGVLVCDSFGGSVCQEANEEETEITDFKFKYFWDQKYFDPITNHALFQIHFQRRGEKKRERVFEYDWRMWTVPELKDIMLEAGFKKVHVYWEGTSKDGEGNGRFRQVQSIREECESWVAYIVAIK